MAHTYTFDSITQIGDAITCVGTVDGQAVTVAYWASALVGMTQQQQVDYVSALMLAALPPQPENLTAQFPSTVTI